jgi:surfactin synthase thioesterase subunit
MNASRWLIHDGNNSRPFRLYCFPFAGGNAFHFTPWQKGVHPDIQVCGVQLPGRGARFRESPSTSLPALVGALAGVIAEQPRQPFAFFGHSLGALIAFEVARECRRRGFSLPMHLFASGCGAPQSRGQVQNLHDLEDDTLIAALKEYNGTPEGILANRDLMTLMMPTIRADLALAEKYEYRRCHLLHIPITVLAGKDDHQLDLEQASAWQKETTNACCIRWFEGDHFFINGERDAVWHCINTTILGMLLPGDPGSHDIDDQNE